MRVGSKTLWCASVIFLLVGCGSRSALDPNPAPGDGGVGGGPGDTLQVDCGRTEQYTSPRRELVLSAIANQPTVSEQWTLADAPDGSTTEVRDTGTSTTTITPDGEGEYVVHYRATNEMGDVAECVISVKSVIGPPIAICPEQTVEGPVGEQIALDGDGYDDEAVVSFAWTLEAGPASANLVFADSMSGMTTVMSDTAGDYVLRLSVQDADGATGTCTVGLHVTSPPSVTCEDHVEVPTRRATTLSARATDDDEIVSTVWEVVSRPERSTATPTRPTSTSTPFTPDRKGGYILRFTATDDDGLTASCETVVTGLPTPPTADCGDRIVTVPLVETEVTGRAVDDGDIARYVWQLGTKPDGSGAAAPSPANQSTTLFEADVVGLYTLRFTVFDDDGQSASCTQEIEAVAEEGLRVEAFWDTNGPDMDLHLLNDEATFWFSPNDCYYANCDSSTGLRLNWGFGSLEDDPRLDIDNVTGFGPENINIDAPQPGTYRIGVHAFAGQTAASQVTVRVYCGEAASTPRAVLGPVTLRGVSGDWSRNDFWRVADVHIGEGTCQVEPLERGGSPYVTAASDAQRKR